MTERRNRVVYAAIMAVVVIAGLSSRSSLAVYMPSFIAEYAGDTLWTVAVYIAVCLIFPSVNILAVGVFAILVSYSVEVLQLYQADWINAVRETAFGKIALGSGFLWSDFACYTTGALACMAVEYLACKLRSSRGG